MADMLKSDIFFIVTTLAIAVLSVALLVLIVYLIRIAKKADEISTMVKEEGQGIVKDIGTIRARMTDTSLHLLDRVSRFVRRKKTPRKSDKA